MFAATPNPRACLTQAQSSTLLELCFETIPRCRIGRFLIRCRRLSVLVLVLLLPLAFKHVVDGVLNDMNVVVDQAFLVFGFGVLDVGNETEISRSMLEWVSHARKAGSHVTC